MNKGLHVLQGPPRSEKTIFVKCFTHQLQLEGKKVLLMLLYLRSGSPFAQK
jgi:KaiC/GvpD/RAD55 family RecA-like ATPase